MFAIPLIIASVLLTVRGYHLAEDSLRQSESEGKIWAVIVAGSSNWWNYRHQSDVCHLYHLLTKQHGIPRKNVITMMYNDIAFNEENPRQGEIINAVHGKDVYEGVMIDYMGSDVTPQNFLDILSGKSLNVGSGKTLKSGPKDTVLVNFVDHGAPGILGFPNDELHLANLTLVLEQMFNNNRYKQMFWYVEACYSGSMFKNLSSSMNITVHTAANEEESSYACFYDNEIGVYLGDCWSTNWMNNTEQFLPNLAQETIEQQYQIVKNETVFSHASIYGDLVYIFKEPISTFLGHSRSETKPKPASRRNISSRRTAATPDVMLEHLKEKMSRLVAVNSVEAERLDKEIRYHIQTEGKVQEILGEISDQVTASRSRDGEIVSVVYKRPQSIEYPECNRDVLSAFFSQCYKMQTHPYITKYLYRLTNLCNAFNSKIIVSAVTRMCPQKF
ncbi:hypothetical protein ACHWQZ_G012069 [Mnemiopsis leidyi]